MRSERETALKLLVIDFRPTDTQLLRTILSEKESKRFSLEYVTSAPAALDKLEGEVFDSVLYTLRVSSKDQFAILRKLVANKKGIPVLMAGPNQTESCLETFFKCGCAGYLNLDHLTFEQFWFSIQNTVYAHKKETILFEKLQRLEFAVEGSAQDLFDWMLPANWQSAFDGPAWFSERFKLMLGYRDEQFCNQWSAWLVKIHPEDQARVIREIRSCIKAKSSCGIECRMLTQVRGFRWFYLRGRASSASAVSCERFSGSLIDITEQKEFPLALREVEEKILVNQK